jgi:prevent-host-death family protein
MTRQVVSMTVTATEFKARCLSLMERVRKTGKSILITKRGRVIAQLTPPPPGKTKPWLRLRGSIASMGDVLSPVVREDEIEALR